MSEDVVPSSVVKHLSAIAVPGMYLYYKYNEFKRQRIEDMKRKVTERELDHLNQKIVSDLHYIFNNKNYLFKCVPICSLLYFCKLLKGYRMYCIDLFFYINYFEKL